ncbi:hypothetical protein HDV00_004509 [Rhizophlyctis rosea]|nr:hypothetical protein HDV00_004509 [Rhizophlyctis rosea]
MQSGNRQYAPTLQCYPRTVKGQLVSPEREKTWFTQISTLSGVCADTTYDLTWKSTDGTTCQDIRVRNDVTAFNIAGVEVILPNLRKNTNGELGVFIQQSGGTIRGIQLPMKDSRQGQFAARPAWYLFSTGCNGLSWIITPTVMTPITAPRITTTSALPTLTRAATTTTTAAVYPPVTSTTTTASTIVTMMTTSTPISTSLDSASSFKMNDAPSSNTSSIDLQIRITLVIACSMLVVMTLVLLVTLYKLWRVRSVRGHQLLRNENDDSPKGGEPGMTKSVDVIVRTRSVDTLTDEKEGLLPMYGDVSLEEEQE